MRDPNRIKDILQIVGQLWRRYPDMRFLQLVQMIVPEKSHLDSQLFYMEDDELVEHIQEKLKS